MLRKLALFIGGILLLLPLLYVATSGPVLRHVVIKKQSTTLLPPRLIQGNVTFIPRPSQANALQPPRFSYAPPHQSFSDLSTPEGFYEPLFDFVENTPLRSPLYKYLQWWGVNSMPVCGNAVMIFPDRPHK